ncbi:MAG: MoaD/ThiS family protein [Pseudomonadota bacterium]
MTRLLYFGRVSDLTGLGEHSATLPETVRDTATLRQWADDVHGAGGGFLDPTIRLAIDGAIVAEPAVFDAPGEIAFMPPVGGG